MNRSEQPIILFDSLIPGLIDLFEFAGILKVRPFADWQEYMAYGEDLSKVQALFVRSTTAVNNELVAKLPALKFVASATSGIDHLETDTLLNRGITWACAKGSNAQAVADYVVYALDGLVRQGVHIKNERAVVLGYGCVGTRVHENLTRLGFHSQWVDPFIAGAELRVFEQQQVEPWLASTTLLCIHTPLTRHLRYPTANWLNSERLAALPDGAVVICAGRGGTLDGAAIKNHCHRLHFVLDVFPNEPAIDPDLVSAAAIATPHIAGHSSLGKLRGSWQVFAAYCSFAALGNLLDGGTIDEHGFYQRQLAKTAQCAGRALHHGVLYLPNDTFSSHNFTHAGIPLIHSYFDLLKTHEQLLEAAKQGSALAVRFKKLRQSYRQHPELRW